MEAVDPGDLSLLVRRIREDRGLDLGQYRERYVERRLAMRLRALGLSTYRQYAEHLKAHPEEFAALLDAITVNVTRFFRDESVFRLFQRSIVPRVIERKEHRHQRMIRAWSAGCATGQEPYSIAMTLVSALGSRADDFVVSVYGTDLDRNALEVARKATYPIDQLAHIPFSDRRFVEVDGDVFRIDPRLARLVRFSYLNLFEQAPIHVVDVIFCRNVFIYFTHEEQERMLERFWEALARGGYLVLGRSERLAPSMNGRLEVVDGCERIYRKPLGTS